MNPAKAQSSSLGTFIATRPAFATVVLLSLGIGGHDRLPHQISLWIALAAALAITGLLFLRRANLSSAAIAGAIYFAGVASAQLYAFHYSPTDVAMFTNHAPQLAQIELRISTPPRTITTNSPFRKNAAHQIARAEVVRVLTKKGFTPATGTILLHIAPPLPELQINQTLRATGILSRPSPAMNPGEFDWAGYLRDDRVLATFAIQRPDAVTPLTNPGPALLDKLRAKARDALAAGFTSHQSLDHAFLRALVLGDTDPELRDVQEDFRRTGTSHHLAISGMHVAILGAVIYYLLLIFRLHPRISIAISLSIILIYGLVVLPSPPVVRSVVLCIAFAIGIFFRRHVDGIQLLSLTALLMLIVRPLDLYNAGFQLSFGCVFGLMFLTKRTQTRFFPPDPDEVVALSLMGPHAPRWLRFKRWLHEKYAAAFSAGIVAWLISLPLILHHFEQLNPWAIFASLLLAVFVFFALLGGFLKIVLTLLLPNFAPTWAIGAGFLIALMRHVLALLAKLPGSDVPLPSFGITAILLYYAILILLLYGRIPRPNLNRFKTRRFATVGAVSALGLVPFIGAIHSADTQQLKLTTLSLGAGLCNVIELPDGQTVIIDAGSSSVSDLQDKILAPFLRHEGRQSVQTLFLSHRDYDHISAASEIVQDYGVRRVFVPTRFNLFADTSTPARQLVKLLETRQRPGKALKTGDLVPLTHATQIEVLWPPPDSTLDSNNTGLVLRLTCSGKSILFPADIQAPAEAELLKHPEKLHADILIAPHHGSSEITTAAFLNAVHPSLIISSNDHTLTQKQKLFDILAKSYRVYRTDQTGAVTVKISSAGQLRVQTFLSR